MEYKITDDSGFLALVNNENYNSFVKENWELDELFNHFVNQMNENSFLIWKTNNGGGYWNLKFVRKSSNIKSFREFKSNIKVTNKKIYLSNYEDLTMAASYFNNKIPSKHNSDLYYELENGLYNITIRQLFDPNNEKLNGKSDFEIVITRNENEDKINTLKKIIWYD